MIFVGKTFLHNVTLQKNLVSSTSNKKSERHGLRLFLVFRLGTVTYQRSEVVVDYLSLFRNSFALGRQGAYNFAGLSNIELYFYCRQTFGTKIKHFNWTWYVRLIRDNLFLVCTRYIVSKKIPYSFIAYMWNDVCITSLSYIKSISNQPFIFGLEIK